jgi:hypothetical protein
VPDIKLDFSRVTYSNLLEIIAPIVPGGILGVGTLVLNPSLAARLLANPNLGYRSRLAAAILVSYCAGLLLNLLVNYTAYFVTYLIAATWGTKFLPTSPTPWRMPLWRALARRFIGPDLAPVTEELYFKDLHDQRLLEATNIQNEELRAHQLKFEEEFFGPKKQAEPEWYWWYQVLEKYFAPLQSSTASWQYYLSMVHTASWAVILLMISNHHNHWFAWFLCIIGLFFGNGSALFSSPNQNDPYAVTQTANLFRELHPISRHSIEADD